LLIAFGWLLWECGSARTACAQEAAEAPAAEAPDAEPASAEPAAEAPAEAEMTEDAPAEDMPAEDAAGDEPAMADEIPLDEDAEEKPKPVAKPKSKRGEAAVEEQPAAPPSPAVEAVLESKPKNPAELLRAIEILNGLGEPKLAQGFVDQLVASKLDTAEKAALAARFHTARLMRLASQPDLSPTLGPFINDLLKSARDYRTDARRLAAWAAQLGSGDENQRALAAQALIAAGENGVAPLVSILADPKRASQHALAKAILVKLDDSSVEPLIGTLESPDAALKEHVVDVLGRIHARRAVPALLATLVSPSSPPALKAAAGTALAKISDRVPTAQEATKLLTDSIESALDQSRAGSNGESRALWHWNRQRQQSVRVDYDTTGASLAEAVRLARALHELEPSDPARRRLYLMTLLATAKHRLGPDKPLPGGKGTARAAAEYYGAAAVADVLADALANGYLGAAAAAAEILGDIGSPAMLTSGGAAPCPLALAAVSPDRRLRYAATSAILKLKPRTPFAGSSQVAESLGFLASSYGIPRVLVVHPRGDQAQSIAGLAAGLGYEADAATNGRQAFELATSSPDYELVLIHSAIDRPRADELVAQLRRDKRTAALPIGLMAPEDDLARVERFARAVQPAAAFLQPMRPEEMKIFVEQLSALVAPHQASAAERKAQATAALDALAAISAQAQQVFDVRRQEPAVTRVLYVPELSKRAAQVLGNLGTASSQRSLLDLAGLATQPLESRQAAAAAFARSVRKFGILMSRDQIMAQYDLYNANAGRNSETHEVLSEILDAIEQKGEAAASN